MATGNDFLEAWPWEGVNAISHTTTKDDFLKTIEKVDINSVRLVLKARRLAKDNNLTSITAWEETISWVVKMLQICKEKNYGGYQLG